MDYNPVTEIQGSVGMYGHRSQSCDARIKHPQIARIVPEGGRVEGMIDDRNAEHLATVLELNGVVVPRLGGQVGVWIRIMRVGKGSLTCRCGVVRVAILACLHSEATECRLAENVIIQWRKPVVEIDHIDPVLLADGHLV